MNATYVYPTPPAAVMAHTPAEPTERPRQEPIRYAVPRFRRNQPCPCGSGDKFKHCHHPNALVRLGTTSAAE